MWVGFSKTVLIADLYLRKKRNNLETDRKRGDKKMLRIFKRLYNELERMQATGEISGAFDEVKRFCELYEQGLSWRVIKESLGYDDQD